MAGPTHASPTRRIVSRPVAAAILSWLAMLGVDLFLQGGLLAPLYDWDSPFLLRPDEAFVRIPIGYLGFLILAVALVWLLTRLHVERGRDGALISAAAGAVAWGAFSLGLWSISAIDTVLLTSWWVAQTVELAIAGLIIGSILGGSRIRTMASRVVALLVAGVASAVLLQTIGYAASPVGLR